MIIPSFIVLLKSFLFKAVTLLALAQVVKVYIELCLRMSTSLLRFNYRGLVLSCMCKCGKATFKRESIFYHVGKVRLA
ncbi:hypothetical protein NC651_016941 [Populus alba x Populus x berolinensis]|nr:hypothetical protein NC651_016941 [Populus alba x Populus x berolinensis]